MLIAVFEDTPIQFITLDFDSTIGRYIVKGDLGLFAQKNIYHLAKTRSPDSTADIIELETLGVKQLAFALSIERQYAHWFIMPTYSYHRLFAVPSGTHIHQYENLPQAASNERDLERHQIGSYFLWADHDRLSIGTLVFTSFPFRRTGLVVKLRWRPHGSDSEWTLWGSRVETDINAMTGQRTSLNRVQYGYSLKF